MNLLIAAILGVIQGLTEFLPVSSTAHLLVAEQHLGFADPAGVFTITIQFGSILAVVWLYRRKLISVMRELPSGSASRRFVVALALATLPIFAAGAVFAKYIKLVLYQSQVAIPVALIAGGIVMLVVERRRSSPSVMRADAIPVGNAFAIGCWQVLALIPGVSRSGATIVGGLMSGLDRSAAAEFSFFLAMPTMAGAFAHEVWESRHDLLTTPLGAEIAVGLVMAFVASALVVGPFLKFVGRSGFAPFAWYRIAAGVVLLGMVWVAR